MWQSQVARAACVCVQTPAHRCEFTVCAPSTKQFVARAVGGNSSGMDFQPEAGGLDVTPPPRGKDPKSGRGTGDSGKGSVVCRILECEEKKKAGSSCCSMHTNDFRSMKNYAASMELQLARAIQ